VLARAGAARELINADNQEERLRWTEECLKDGPLGAAAIAEAFAGDDLQRWIREELYGPTQTAANYLPGEICRQIPLLREIFGEELRIMTTNYDNLIEQAFAERGVDAVAISEGRANDSDDTVSVVHLHGYTEGDGTLAELVLTEAQYQRMQQQYSWQEERVREALSDSTVLFVGASLIDPNLIRYLHREEPAGPPCLALFPRQGRHAGDIPPAVPQAREQGIHDRWASVGVEVVFVDHFVDTAQTLYEIGRARRDGAQYRPLVQRATEWVEMVEQNLLGYAGPERYQRAQRGLCRLLQSALERATAAAEELEDRQWNEVLALSMWLVDRDGRHLTNSVMTDRVHVDMRTIEPVEINEHSRWAAVRAYCFGQALAETREIYASRWKFIRALPLIWHEEPFGRMPVGCLTATSMETRENTMLNEMDDVVEARFNRTLVQAAREMLRQPFANDQASVR
jgi:hypothetical protein